MSEGHAAWARYHSLSLRRKREWIETLRPLDTVDVAGRWFGQTDPCARDVLIERGVFDTKSSSSVNDYAHWLLVENFGAKRIHPPPPRRRYEDLRRTGVAHRRDTARAL